MVNLDLNNTGLPIVRRYPRIGKPIPGDLSYFSLNRFRDISLHFSRLMYTNVTDFRFRRFMPDHCSSS